MESYQTFLLQALLHHPITLETSVLCLVGAVYISASVAGYDDAVSTALGIVIASVYAFVNQAAKTASTKHQLPPEVLFLILAFSKDETDCRLMFANKALYEHYKKTAAQQPERYGIRHYLNNTTAAQRLCDKQSIFLTHPQEFIDELGGYKQIVKIPILNISNQMGATHYLDFHVDLPVSTPAVRGFDRFGRPFYFATAHMDNIVYFFKLFQRHMNQKNLWVSAQNGGEINGEINEAQGPLTSGEQILNYLTDFKDTEMNQGVFFNTPKYPLQEQARRSHLFMAQLLTKGVVSYPNFQMDNIMLTDATIPTENDEHYRPITLGL